MNRVFTFDEPESEPEEIATPGAPPELSPDALRGVAGDIVHRILPHTEASAPALLFNLLSGFGNMAGRDVYTAAGSIHHARLFGVLAGPTGTGRKGTSWKAARSILAEIDPQWSDDCQASGMSSGEGKGRIVDYQDEIVDAGVTDKRLFLIEEEFGSVLKRMNGKDNTLSTIIREAWDGNDLRTLIKNAPDQATEPHISIVAHITKPEAVDLISNVDCQNGFVNRFLWIYTDRSKFLPDAGLIPVEDCRPEIEALKGALNRARIPREIPLDPEARELWRAVYRDLSAGKPGIVGSVTARAEAYARRLALTYALMDGADEQSVTHMESALALWRYSEATAQWIFGTPFNHLEADRIYKALKNAPDGRMTRTDINGIFHNHASAEKLDEAANIMEKQGSIYRDKKDTGGRKQENWILTDRAK